MIKNFIKNYRTKWMIWKSSKFLIQKMIKNIDFSKDLKIVQLWSWKAVFVKQVLKKMSKNSKLYVFEINPDLEKYIKNFKIDTRLVYISDSAENLEKYISEEVDVVISTLPFASLSKELCPLIVSKSRKILKKDGIFLQYQYFLTNKKSIEKIFEKKASLSFTPLNFPPAFIYKLTK